MPCKVCPNYGSWYNKSADHFGVYWIQADELRLHQNHVILYLGKPHVLRYSQGPIFETDYRRLKFWK